MIGLDTNVVIRFLVQDDEEQSKAATDLFANLSADNCGFICSIVLAEITWVLDRTYKIERALLADIIERLLRSEELIIEHASSGYRALILFRDSTSIGFADAFIAEIAACANAVETVTFDRKAAAEAGMRLLEVQ